MRNPPRDSDIIQAGLQSDSPSSRGLGVSGHVPKPAFFHAISVFRLRRFRWVSLTAPHPSGEIHPSLPAVASRALRQLLSQKTRLTVHEPARPVKETQSQKP